MACRRDVDSCGRSGPCRQWARAASQMAAAMIAAIAASHGCRFGVLLGGLKSAGNRGGAIRGKIIALLLTGVGLAACSSAPGEPGFAGHPIDCGLGFAHSDCAPGTPGYRAAIAAREAAAARDDADAARCQSFGLKYGTPEYAQCRMNIDNQRAANFRAAVSAPPAQPQPALQLPTTTNCTTFGSSYGYGGNMRSGSINCTTQ
jgi:hypothetical protein